LAESFALHFSGRAAARLDEPPLVVTNEVFSNSVLYLADRQITLFCFGYRLLKHKVIIRNETLG